MLLRVMVIINNMLRSSVVVFGSIQCVIVTTTLSLLLDRSEVFERALLWALPYLILSYLFNGKGNLKCI